MKKLMGTLILTLVLECSLPVWSADRTVIVDSPSDPVGDVIAAPFNFIGQVFAGDGTTVVSNSPDVYGYYGYAEPGYTPSIYRWGYWDRPWYNDRYDYWGGPAYWDYGWGWGGWGGRGWGHRGGHWGGGHGGGHWGGGHGGGHWGGGRGGGHGGGHHR